MDKEPKKPAEWQDEDQNQLVVTNLPPYDCCVGVNQHEGLV